MEPIKFCKLSHQALVQLMVALQKCLAEQSDIVPILMDFNWYEDANELFIENPIMEIKMGEVEETKEFEELFEGEGK